MRKKSRKPPCRKIVLRLPDLDHTKAAVLNTLSSPHSRRNYKFAMEQFITWYCSEPRLALNRAVVLRFRLHLESLGLGALHDRQPVALHPGPDSGERQDVGRGGSSGARRSGREGGRQDGESCPTL